MPITAGTVSGRVWRVVETLPPNFKEMFERNLARHAFKPIDPERGQLQAVGWVNIRQLLDSRLTLEKVLFRNLIALGLRVDRLAINQRVFRATLAQEIGKKFREKGKELSREEKLVIEDKIRLDLIKRTQPATAVYEMIWQLESGTVLFGSGSQKLGLIFPICSARLSSVGRTAIAVFARPTLGRAQPPRPGAARTAPLAFSPEAPVDVVEAVPEDGKE